MKDILRLVFAFIAFAAFAGSAATSGSVNGSGVGSLVGISLTFFIGNNFYWKLSLMH